MTFTKKNHNVPENYNLNFDKDSKKWRLRIKREGKWETAGRFETEALAVAFANQSSKFNAQAKAGTVEKKEVEVLKTPEVVPVAKGSTLEKVRSAARGKKVAPKEEVELVLEQLIPEVKSVLPTVTAEVAKEPTSILKLQDRSNESLQFLKMQSRIVDLQRTIEEHDVVNKKDKAQVEAALRSASAVEKESRDALKEFARLRDSLRTIIDDKTLPQQKDIESLYHQLAVVNDSIAQRFHDNYVEEQKQDKAFQELQGQVETINAREIGLAFLVAICLVLSVFGIVN